jgi:hypothetical protein
MPGAICKIALAGLRHGKAPDPVAMGQLGSFAP